MKRHTVHQLDSGDVSIRKELDTADKNKRRRRNEKYHNIGSAVRTETILSFV